MERTPIKPLEKRKQHQKKAQSAQNSSAVMELDELQWRAPEWLQAFGGLRTDNVLEYFSQSPFFDRSSNNQVLKMQSQFSRHLQTADLTSELTKMRGIEFILALAREPDYWVIVKQERLSPIETIPLAVYFVMNENIYMAPSVYNIASSRLINVVYSLRQALSIVSKVHHFSPSNGYSYLPDTLVTVEKDSDSAIDNSKVEDEESMPATETEITESTSSNSEEGITGESDLDLDDSHPPQKVKMASDSSILFALQLSVRSKNAYLENAPPDVPSQMEISVDAGTAARRGQSRRP